MVIDLFQKHLEQYILKISGLLEIDNPHAFLQLKFSSKVDWKRYDIVYIIIEKVISTGDAIFRSSIWEKSGTRWNPYL